MIYRKHTNYATKLAMLIVSVRDLAIN